ncbi:conserved glutamic acid-rich protein [Rutstroemia sp. NJR-2017a WRK4]|nr:conserved glutamic acid-rich protein [Rutstroemia sp. NJR-2017a WRK4]
MADDSMELASEHGHDIIEEDIDIDIDINSGHVDEDDILDDIDEANVDISTNAQNDDLMVDDDDDPSFHMEDADLLQEEVIDHNMEQDLAGTSADEDGIAHVTFDEIHAAQPTTTNIEDSELVWDNAANVAGVFEVADTTLANQNEAVQITEEAHVVSSTAIHDVQETTQAVEQEPEQAEPTAPEPQHIVRNDVESTSNHDEGKDLENSPAPSPRAPTDQGSREATPQMANPDDQSTYITEANHETSHTAAELGPDTNNSNDEQTTIQAEGGDTQPSTTENPPTEEPDDFSDLSHSHEILVKYNGRKYPLIRKSPSDHPNDFFFEDPSVLAKPLVDFCTEIRAVLVEENLPEKDKVTLIIEELQLVIDETHLTHYPADLSLSQIISLYERLCSNDGSDAIAPLNLRLVIEPTGYDRFSMLLQGAAEGKGLSEYLTWNDDSEDDPTEFGELTEAHDFESNFDEQLLETSHEESGADIEDKHDYNLDSKTSLESHNDEQHESLQYAEIGDTASAEIQPPEQENVPSDSNDQELATINTRQTKQEEISVSVDETNDDDGDIIDYDDEENVEGQSEGTDTKNTVETGENRPHDGTSTYFYLPCILPVTCFCSSCNDSILIECRAADEGNNRRGSIPLKAEDEIEESAHEIVTATADAEATAETTENTEDAQSDIGYEDEAEENFKKEIEDDLGPEYTVDNDENAEGSDHSNEPSNAAGEHTLDNETAENEEDRYDDGQDQASYAPATEQVELSFTEVIENSERQIVEDDEFDLGEGADKENGVYDEDQLGDSYEFDGDALDIPADEEFIATTSVNGSGDVAESDSATISNASIADLQSSHSITADGQNQEDEIGYDDDDEEEEPGSPTIQQATPSSPKDSPGSSYGKRPRAEADFEDGESQRTKGPKILRLS